MSLTVTHRFVSAKTDSSDTTLINPSNWNDDHALVGSIGYVEPNNFEYQTPSEDLSPSLKTFTLEPVPLGVNGTNVDHYLALYDASNNFLESVLIVGGSALSEASSGTIIVDTIVGSYAAGEYQVGSATAGIQEAIRTIAVSNGYGYGPGILVPTGRWPIYATITFDNLCCMRGCGGNSTILQKAFTDGDLIYIGDSTTTLAGISQVFSDFMLEPFAGITDTSGYAINVRYRYNVTIANITLYGDGGIGRFKNGIKFDSCLTFSLLNTKILNVSNIGLECTAVSPNQCTGRISVVDVTSPGTTNDMVYFHGNLLSFSIDGLQMQGGYRNWFIDTTGGAFSECQINNIIFDSATHAAFVLQGTGGVFKLNFTNICLSTIFGVPNSIGMVFDGTTASVFSQITISGLTGGVNASNQTGTALFLLSVTNFLLTNSQIQGAGAGIGDTSLQIQGVTKNVTISNSVIGYAYDGGIGGSEAYRAVYVPSGTHSNLLITGCTLYGTATSLGIAGAHTNFKESDNLIAGGGAVFAGTGTALCESMPVAYANLPPATNLVHGKLASISDSNTDVWGATASSGGALLVKVWCTNSAWTVIGK